MDTGGHVRIGRVRKTKLSKYDSSTPERQHQSGLEFDSFFHVFFIKEGKRALRLVL